MTTITDTDKGGQGFQKQRVYLGPSLGWSEEFVQPSSHVVSGVYNVQPGDGLLLVDSAAPTTINLPDVTKWFTQPADQPATGWNRQLCIKDFGGNASVNNITVVPFGGQRIDADIGPTTITVDYAVFLLVPNVDLSGWIIAAGTTSVLIPVGTFLPVHDPAATGKLTVREIGGDIAYMQGGAAGSQSVSFGADAASADADVNINFNPKGIGGNLFYSQGALQVDITGAADANKFLVLSGGSTAQFPTIASSFGGRINIRDSARVGPIGGNQAFIDGSVAGQSAISYQADPLSIDPDVNIHLIPKGSGGVNLYSSGALQASVVGPGFATNYLVISGTSSYNDPVLATALGGPIRVDDALVAGPAGGNFAGIYGSAAGGQSVAVRADNVFNPDAVINIDFVPKGTGGACLFWSSGSQQAIVAGPSGANRLLAMSGAVAPNNPKLFTAFGGNVEIPDLVMTGAPVAPTVTPATDSTTKVATTAFVHAAIASSPGGGNVSNVGTPAAGQYARWTTATTIEARTPAQVATDIGALVAGANNVPPGQTTIQSTVVANSGLYLEAYQAVVGGTGINFKHSRGATVGSQVALQSGDGLGNVIFQGSDGSAFTSGATIAAFCSGAPVAGHVPTQIRFTTDDGAANAQRVVILASGGVTLNPPFTTDPGAGGILCLNLTATQFIDGPWRGVANNSAAGAGFVGQYIEAFVVSNTALGSAGTISTVNSISLTAGDWDVWAHTTWTMSSGAPATGEIELTTTTTLSGDIRTYTITTVPTNSIQCAIDQNIARFALNATTTVNLVARPGAANMNVANSIIKARRTR